MHHSLAQTFAAALAVTGLALFVAAPVAAQTKPIKIEWTKGTPEVPKKREEGKVAEGPIEGPEKPQIRELQPT